MSRFALSLRAKANLSGIWDYTAQTRSVDQAERYIRRIADTVTLIAESPALGRNCGHIRGGYLKYPVGLHVLFYRPINGGIEIARILHQQWISIGMSPDADYAELGGSLISSEAPEQIVGGLHHPAL